MTPLLTLHCPECHDLTLECRVEGTGMTLLVFLESQSCLCDPFHAWEDVWEEAREIVYEREEID